MYRTRPSLVFGFHVCEQKLAEDVLAGKRQLRPSKNEWDWLGHGVYFWENSPERARQFARDLREGERGLKKPFVLGATIHLDRCFDLLDSASLSVLKEAYRSYVEASKQAGIPLPVNKTARGGGELLLRQLDCAVFQHMFQQFEADEVYPPFDTVRAAFWEGNELFPRAGFREKDHIQICVRNPNCIKGYFRELPLNKDTKYPGI